MQRLGTLSGTGSLVVGATSFDSIAYTIHVWMHRGLKSANGSLEGRQQALIAAFNTGKAKLALEDGRIVDVIITKTVGSEADIQVSGPVPGY